MFQRIGNNTCIALTQFFHDPTYLQVGQEWQPTSDIHGLGLAFGLLRWILHSCNRTENQMLYKNNILSLGRTSLGNKKFFFLYFHDYNREQK